MSTLFRPRGWWWRASLRVSGRLVRDVAFLFAVLLFLGIAVGPRTGHYRTVTMLTGSMSPAYPPGSVVVVVPQRSAEVREGQVLTFVAPTPERRVVTHRVVEVVRTQPRVVVRTKGDANAEADPWLAEISDDVVWRARADIPMLGTVIRMLREPWVGTALLYVLPGLLLSWLLAGVWRRPAQVV